MLAMDVRPDTTLRTQWRARDILHHYLLLTWHREKREQNCQITMTGWSNQSGLRNGAVVSLIWDFWSDLSNPRIRDLYLELGSGDPKTRYKFKRKFGLFQCFKAQKILKYNTKLFPERIFFLGAFILEILSLGWFGSKGVPNSRVRYP